MSYCSKCGTQIGVAKFCGNCGNPVKQTRHLDLSKEIRLGGMVKKNSIKVNKREIQFIITDLKKEILVSYKGTVPNLFLEEKGVIAEGKLKDKKFFIANRVLAKHDENYKPPSENQLDKK